MDRVHLLLRRVLNDVEELIEEAKKKGMPSVERVMEHVKSHLLVLEEGLRTPESPTGE